MMMISVSASGNGDVAVNICQCRSNEMPAMAASACMQSGVWPMPRQPSACGGCASQCTPAILYGISSSYIFINRNLLRTSILYRYNTLCS